MIAVLVYIKYAPMHIARLEAALALGRKFNHQLVGIEIADTQADYNWPPHAQPGGDTLYTLFPGREYWSLSHRTVRRSLSHALNDISPDVVVLPGWGFSSALAGLGWCIKRDIPRVVVSDSYHLSSSQNQMKLWLKRLIVSRFQAGFAGGQPHVQYLNALGLTPERCFVGCDVVDNDFFRRESQRWRDHQPKPQRGGPVLFSCLRLLPRKNIIGVLEVMADHVGWTWMIAGDGPQRAEIEERIEALGLRDRVTLLGHVDYFDLPRFYAQADAYIQPSVTESWGLAVNEAMASGLPVLVSNRCGCHEDLVREAVNGFTFDPAKQKSLGDSLDLLLAQRDRWGEMGQASQRIIGDWGLDLFAKNFWRACDEAILLSSSEGRRERVISKALSFAL